MDFPWNAPSLSDKTEMQSLAFYFPSCQSISGISVLVTNDLFVGHKHCVIGGSGETVKGSDGSAKMRKREVRRYKTFCAETWFPSPVFFSPLIGRRLPRYSSRCEGLHCFGSLLIYILYNQLILLLYDEEPQLSSKFFILPLRRFQLALSSSRRLRIPLYFVSHPYYFLNHGICSMDIKLYVRNSSHYKK